MLEEVGLSHRRNNFPAQLSGGEQQRVSIARALAKNPKILLCDEPHRRAGYKTGKQVLALLQATCREKGRTVIVITHNSALAAMADRVIRINSGRVVEHAVQPGADPGRKDRVVNEQGHTRRISCAPWPAAGGVSFRFFPLWRSASVSLRGLSPPRPTCAFRWRPIWTVRIFTTCACWARWADR